MRCTIVLEFDDGDAIPVKGAELMRLHRTDCAASGDCQLVPRGKPIIN